MADPAFELMYTDQDEVDLEEELIEEYYYSSIQRHEFLVLTQPGGSGLNIYGEPGGDPETAAIGPTYSSGGSIPIAIKLDPEEELLDRYGYDRTRDAICWFSRKIMDDLGINPKVGDRINFSYVVDTGSTVVEQLIINEVSPVDFQRQTKVAFNISAACNRTHRDKVTV